MKKLILIASLFFGVAAIAGGVRAMWSNSDARAATTFYGDGTKKNATEYHDGVKHGRSEQWYPDGGTEWLGEYHEGFRHGSWTFWNEDGSVDSERSGVYERGQRVGDLAQ